MAQRQGWEAAARGQEGTCVPGWDITEGVQWGKWTWERCFQGAGGGGSRDDENRGGGSRGTRSKGPAGGLRGEVKVKANSRQKAGNW